MISWTVGSTLEAGGSGSGVSGTLDGAASGAAVSMAMQTSSLALVEARRPMKAPAIPAMSANTRHLRVVIAPLATTRSLGETAVALTTEQVRRRMSSRCRETLPCKARRQPVTTDTNSVRAPVGPLRIGRIIDAEWTRRKRGRRRGHAGRGQRQGGALRDPLECAQQGVRRRCKTHTEREARFAAPPLLLAPQVGSAIWTDAAFRANS